ncbi:DNA-binding response regulator, NarL/FixJ family, contains REC and HTH domains [Brevibacterium sandarakinum]|uniref:DNA-binding response regulator, NarL/FixJ family, contains REC and HTH domains n=1 Tax=Brevibacterium sandarakinum TaxID=629680 RepID=A0A1H1NYK9_BRESA|nr:response regulator transcription factor [Brevibacterium sandarakinum]SDS04071.1 DNA-binding response regulator, NarL/FixJ family, contains REC and HTH domains [Brevibacterium sandarakinum]
MTVRVVLVDDQEMIRMGLRMVLESQPGIEIVGDADDGDSALELLGQVEADVVLMDVRMPRMNGVEATLRIREREGAPEVLILTTFDLDEYAYDGLQAGASGFLLKDTPVEDIAAAISHIHNGDAVVAPSTTKRLLDHFTRSRLELAGNPAPGGRLEELTPREHEVLQLIARGMSNAEIAAHLVLAEGTVKVHVGRILTKLGLRDRVQAVVLAYESGLVEAGEH